MINKDLIIKNALYNSFNLRRYKIFTVLFTIIKFKSIFYFLILCFYYYHKKVNSNSLVKNYS